MASFQRNRGEVAYIYQVGKTTDLRQNVVESALSIFLTVRAVFAPDRSARAEMPGQQQVSVFTMITSSDLSGVSLYSLVKWRNSWWDIVSPPAWHIGDRHTRHWSIIIRWRPDNGGNLA